jgi:uncharacterized protein
MADFEWDPEKDRQNRAKHGISFEEAATIFDGATLSGADEGDYDGEIRELTFGLLRGVVVVCVSHTLREERIRIISARKATPRERRLFNAYNG